MKHRFLVSALAAVMLASGIGTVSTTVNQPQEVQAISKHSYHWHWVRTTKNRAYYKLRFPLYKAPKYEGILRKGSRVKIRFFENNDYYQVKGLGRGQMIVKGSSTSWFRNR